MDNYTTYPSGLIVVDPGGIYSKHYYIGTQRIASRIGDGTAVIFEGKSADMSELKSLQKNDLLNYLLKEGVKRIEYAKYEIPDLQETAGDEGDNKGPGPGASLIKIYYYHPDHLGTNTLLTDINGNARGRDYPVSSSYKREIPTGSGNSGFIQ